MLIWVPMNGTEKISTPTVEPCQTNTFPASVAPIWTFLHLFLTLHIQWRSRGCFSWYDHGLQWTSRQLYSSSSNSRLLCVGARAATHNTLNRRCCKFSLFLLQNQVLVALGTQVHGCCTSKEATVVGTKLRCFRRCLASCLVVIHFLKSSLQHQYRKFSTMTRSKFPRANMHSIKMNVPMCKNKHRGHIWICTDRRYMQTKYSLGSMDTSIRVSYLCRTGVVLAVLCYNFSEISHVVVPYPYLCLCFLEYSRSNQIVKNTTNHKLFPFYQQELQSW